MRIPQLSKKTRDLIPLTFLKRPIWTFLMLVFLLPFSSLAQSFSSSNLNFNGNGGVNSGTSLMFGPDGKLYVLSLNGNVDIFTIQRNGVDNYVVIASEELTFVKDIPNHNDDGSNAGNNVRQATGLTVAGTAADPVIYVTSSDPRVGAGGSGNDANLDTNSGVITRIKKVNGNWEAVDIVRGLPRSEENHATNGLEFVTIGSTDYLIVCSGGHANAGAPSNNFALTTEYALSAAVLSVNLTMLQSMPILTDGNGRSYIYDLPTVDDPTRANANGVDDPNATNYDGVDVNDPWGGNDGLNQAVIVPGGPVQIFSPGYRNTYDLVLTQDGKVFVTDNGANGGWGGLPENEGLLDGFGNSLATNNYVPGEPGSSSATGNEQVDNEDHLTMVTDNIQTYSFGSFYGGHPTPIRANPAGAGLYTGGSSGSPIFRTKKYDPNALPGDPDFTSNVNEALPADWPPVPLAQANPDEGDWRGPTVNNPDGPNDVLVTTWGNNTNGIDEYTASNFNGAMQGDLIAGKNGGVLRRVELNANGSLANLTSNFATNLGGNALGITCNSDSDPFPGTIWVATFNSNIVVLEPQDFVICILPSDPGYDGTADNDSDGYSNQDEIDNKDATETDEDVICSGINQPNDFDKAAGGILVSDLNDPDDDNDGILDANDPFQLGDPTDPGSDAFDLPVINTLLSDDPVLKGYLGLGLTGLMNNGNANPNWLDWLDEVDAGPNPNDLYGGAVGSITMQMTEGTADGTTNTQEKGFQYGVNVDQSTGSFSVESYLKNFNDPLQLYGNTNAPNGEMGIFIGDGTQSNFIKFVITKTSIEAIQEIGDVPQTPGLSASVSAATGNELFLRFEINAVSGVVTLKYALDNSGTFQTLGTINAAGAVLNAIQSAGTPLAVGLIGSSKAAGVEIEATWDFLDVVGDQPTISQVLPPLAKLVNDPADNINLDNYFDDDAGVANLTYTVETNTADPAIGASISGNTLTLTYPATPANGNITIRATDGGGLFVEQTFNVDVSDPPVTVYRVNSNGALYTDGDGEVWEADNYFTGGSIYANGGQAIANTTDDALYQGERYGNFSYNFPVSNGDYTVELHFAEIYFGVPGGGSAGGVGSRVFNVNIEGGAEELTNYDIVADVGPGAAVVKSFPVTVNDGSLDIVFTTVTNNAKVSAIAVLNQSGSGTPLSLSPIPNQSNEEGEEPDPALSVTATGGDGNLSYAATGLPPGVSLEPTNGDFFGTITAGAEANSPYTVTVTVDDADAFTNDAVTTTFQWTVGLPTAGPEALIEVLAGGTSINASTFGNNSFSISNTSQGGQQITQVVIDLTTNMLPEIVLDPNGTAGDATAKAFTVGTNGTSGTISHNLSNPFGLGGFQTLTIDFSDFNPGESMTFAIDVDPTSIEGLLAPGPGDAGSVSGLEIVGSEVTVTFDGTVTYQNNLYSDGSNAGSLSRVKASVASPLNIVAQGLTSPATTNTAAQTINITGGPANGSVSLLRVEGAFFEGGSNLNQLPFEVNTVTVIDRQTGIVLDGSGNATVNVTLTDSNPEGGYNYFIAAVEDGADFGATSNTLVLEYDDQFTPPSAGILYRINTGGPLVAATDAPNPDWEEDTGNQGAAGNSQYLAAISTGTSTFAQTSTSAYQGPIVMTDPSLPAGTPADLFQTERWDALAAPEMLWQFPVAPGTQIEVRLYFAEIFSGITAAGERVFDVSIEGTVPANMTGIDQFATTGALGAFMLSHTLTVTDGTLDIEFIHVTENPNIKGIEIVAVGPSNNNPPVVTNPGTQSGVEGDPVNLSIAASDVDDCGGLTYSATGLPPSLTINPSTGVISGTLDAGTGSGPAGAFIESSGLLILEAETDFVNTAGGWNPLSEPPVDYLVASSDHFGSPNGQNLTYNLQINTPGVYRLHMKSDITGTNTTEENDSWIRIVNTTDVHYLCVPGGITSEQQLIDNINGTLTNKTLYYPAGNAMGRPDHGNENPGNSGYFKVYRSGGGGNKWDAKTIDNNGFPIFAYFPNAGTFTLELSERSGGHKVDRLALYKVDNTGGTGVPTATLDGPESSQTTGGTLGAAAGSPYNVNVTVTDNCVPPASTTESFVWNVSATPPTGAPSALLVITPGAGLGASTFGGSDNFVLTNQSTGNIQITSVSIDLSTGLLPDMVFDPVGTGGDATAQCFNAGSNSALTGLIAPTDPCVDPFSQPRQGGFDIISANFSDFDPTESFSWSVDIDPNSIQGVPGAGGAGSVSGFELVGATVTISFSDGSTLVSSLYEDGSLGGAQAVVAPNAPATPTISAVGTLASPTCVTSPNQVIEVNGNPGDNVSLLLMDSRLYIQSGAPAFNVSDPTYYANEAMANFLYTGVIGPGGTVQIPVTLLETVGDPAGSPDGGLNHIVAVTSSGPYAVGQQVSMTSNVLILKVDPNCTAVGASLNVNATLQGRTDHSGTYAVKFYDANDGTLVYDLTATADAFGDMSVTGIAPGDYEVAVKYPNSLQVVQAKTIAAGTNSISMGQLPGGDANGIDNQVSLLDFSILAGIFNTPAPNPGLGADFNGDGFITALDFSILASNFGTQGQVPTN
jgi:hypothetical protein